MRIADADLVTVLSDHLPNESLQGAVYARVTSGASFAHWLGPVGNYLVARPSARKAARAITERTGLPLDAAVVLAVSASALHVWSADPMLSRVTQHLGSISREDVSSATTEPGRSWQTLTITFRNGSSATLEARGGVHQFVSALQGAGTAPQE